MFPTGDLPGAGLQKQLYVWTAPGPYISRVYAYLASAAFATSAEPWNAAACLVLSAPRWRSPPDHGERLGESTFSWRGARTIEAARSFAAAPDLSVGESRSGTSPRTVCVPGAACGRGRGAVRGYGCPGARAPIPLKEGHQRRLLVARADRVARRLGPGGEATSGGQRVRVPRDPGQFHSRTVLSLLVVASRCPSGLNATLSSHGCGR